MRLIVFALLLPLLMFLPACVEKSEPAQGQPEKENPEPAKARLEDAPFAKGPQMGAPFSIKGPAYDLAYDPYRARVYASLNGDKAGMVARIKPDTGELDGAVRLTGEVGPMALSPDGAQLWVVVYATQTPKLCRIDLKTMTAGERQPLRPSDFNTSAPDALVMVAGTNSSFVASYVGYKNVVVFDAGRARPEQIQGKHCAWVTYSGEGQTYFSFNDADTGWQLHELLVTDKGIRVVREHVGVIDRFGATLAAGGGRVYPSNGRIFDMKARKTIGQLPGYGNIAIDTLNRRAYQVRYEPYHGNYVAAFDWESFEPRASYLARINIPFRDTAKLELTMTPTGGLPSGRYLGRTCKPVLMLGETGLVINRDHVLTFLPTADILKAERK